MSYRYAPVPCDDCHKKVKDIAFWGYEDQRVGRDETYLMKMPIYLCPECKARREKVIDFPGGK